MSIVINTPNGTIGRKLTLALLDAGEAVTVLSRDATRVSDLAERGARVIEGSFDEATLRTALTGAETLFWLTPPHYVPDFMDWSRQAAQRAAQIAAEAGVVRAVVLSSVGAHSEAVGPVSALGPVEAAFKAQLPHVTVLRPGFFMENYLRDVGTIATMGKIFSPADGDRPMPMVATADIARRAAQVLRDRNWQGHRVLGIHGPRNLSFREGAQIVGQALGREIEYVQVSADQARASMLEAGLPPHVAQMFVQMYQAMNDGRMDPAEPRDAASTTATELAQFARDVLKPAIAAAA
ncbi:MAG: NmrA family NAD(P)-binding protein [Myxococcota bacterium]